ncbi:hypothetical protein L4174_023845 (plasmid) [Photobacterium sp. CCB-ST2H9]|uniref:hypothetical protein n=1 Tax=Photobacterium sp. CCB-ST2H9 TaxID=2912855 RepID=UPI002005A99B|nr:hypothetical protein [Photobacterium sp. CCB-ST2H9]UTM60420.1 hypothetical protein L4174_023845 [Photobacterium sp. CCB-ST2H9]
MLNTPELVEQFKNYIQSGGIQDPQSSHIAADNVETAGNLETRLKSALMVGIDYTADGIDQLPIQIEKLISETEKSQLANRSWRLYLNVAKDPSDLMNVSAGVKVLRQVQGLSEEEQNKPAPSIKPFSDTSLVVANREALQSIESEVPGIIDLMERVNSALTPITSSTGGAETTPAVQPPLSEELKTAAMAMIKKLSPLLGLVGESSASVQSAADNASVERENAIKAFNDAVNLTLIRITKDNPIIGEAVNKISPI